MKTLNTLTTLSLLLSLGALTNCGQGLIMQGHTSREVASTVAEELNDEQMSERSLLSAIGVKDFNQIESTFVALTGVDAANATVKATVDSEKGNLPGSNDLAAFGGAQQVAIIKIAVSFCDVMLNNPVEKARHLPNGFAANRENQEDLSASERQSISQSFVDRFWKADLALLPDRLTTIQNLDNLMRDVQAASNTVTNINVTKTICGVVLSSAPITIN